MPPCKSYNMGCPGIPNYTISLTAITVAPHNNTENFWQWFPDRDQPTTDSDIEFPEEGVYLCCQDRAVQIAAGSCAVRKCERTKICSCNHHDDEFSRPFPNNNLFEQRNVGYQPCVECLHSWFNLTVIQGFVDRFAMTLIAHPKPLHLTHIFGKPLMAYDFADDTYFSRTDQNVLSTHMALELDIWNDLLSSMIYHNSQTSPRSQSLSSLYNNITSDDDIDIGIDIVELNDSFLIVENRTSGVDKDDFDCFDDIIEEEFPHSRAFRQDLDKLDKEETSNNQFIFGLDGLGKIDGPDMTELPEDDNDMVPVVKPGSMDFTLSQSNIVSDYTRSRYKSSNTHNFSVSEDSDEDMGENETVRYHYCTRKPCPLNCQDPDSRNPWRCMDDHPNNRRRGEN